MVSQGSRPESAPRSMQLRGVLFWPFRRDTGSCCANALSENGNYALKSSFLLSFLESVPELSSRLIAPNTKERSTEDVVKSAQQTTALVLVY
jgi:hypothetical protein